MTTLGVLPHVVRRARQLVGDYRDTDASWLLTGRPSPQHALPCPPNPPTHGRDHHGQPHSPFR
ncbi:hypothetical protein [Paractinoplanes toevensis]|uniref:hypothetical protein n=1 Tax=Paractinoplanes toevensis TaxID=571911 RepID=UPI001BB3EDF4|nr:hypothetical protein [Actinoplanes toevensis]